MDSKIKILLLCGGAFAFKTIQLLADENYLFAVGIGKGTDVIVNSMENACESKDIQFKSFANKKDIAALKPWIEAIKPTYVFCVSFPFLIPETVLDDGSHRFINFHPAPLPQYRGVMPIFEVIKNQEKETAICAHFMNSKFDEGDIIFNDPIGIEPHETYGSLSNKLSNRMAQVVINMANMLQFSANIPSQKQDERLADYYAKPELQDTFIYWKNMEASEIMALINACNPWNEGADALLNGKAIKIIEARVSEYPHDDDTIGKVLSINDDHEMTVTCMDNKQIAISIVKTDTGFQSIQKLSKTTNLINQTFQ
uniref:methionyl-tRNA formyltransferase n=1 Tax=Flavobacterium sp. TaxID=239 RepID=UPI00404A23DD